MAEGRRVGLVFGGRSAEHQVSIRSARTVAAALADAGHEVVPFGVAVDGGWVDHPRSLAALEEVCDTLHADDAPTRPSLRRFLAAEIDVAFPLVHGTWGEDGTLQGLFETLDLPYVGAGVTASAVAMDKVLCKRQLEAVGVRTVEFATFDRSRWRSERDACLESTATLAAPLFVKPSVGGSSVGIARVEDRAELAGAVETAFEFDDRVLVERGVEGLELECAVLGYRTMEASRVGEIVPGHAFYDYADKYLEDGARLEMPAKIDAEVERSVREISVRAFRAIGGVGMARVDFLLDQTTSVLYVNEINTLPGFTSISMYPKLWALSGTPIPDLVDRLVDIAIRRHADRAQLHRSIAGWIDDLEARP